MMVLPKEVREIRAAMEMRGINTRSLSGLAKLDYVYVSKALNGWPAFTKYLPAIKKAVEAVKVPA
jgi:hypothetical protein